MLKNMNEIAKEVAEREAGKESLSIAQIKEVLGIVCDICYEDTLALITILKAGVRRNS